MQIPSYDNVKVSIGQDSHAFEESNGKPLILGGVVFEGYPGMRANSDGDVVLHSITNAVSGVTCRNILGKPADEMCKSGITDSAEYLKDERVKPLRDIFMTYELLAYLSVRATQLGYKACEIPVTRAYPKTGKVPTKISFFKGNSELMKILFKNLFGAYKPEKERS